MSTRCTWRTVTEILLTVDGQRHVQSNNLGFRQT